MNNEPFWNQSIFQDMEPQKLQFIQTFAAMQKPSSMKDAMPFLMAQMGNAKRQNINFTSPEVSLICEILSKDLPPEEQKKVQQVLRLLAK